MCWGWEGVVFSYFVFWQDRAKIQCKRNSVKIVQLYSVSTNYRAGGFNHEYVWFLWIYFPTVPKSDERFLVSCRLPCFYLFHVGVQVLYCVWQHVLMSWFIHLVFQFVMTAFKLRYSFERCEYMGKEAPVGRNDVPQVPCMKKPSPNSAKPIWRSFKVSSHPISPGLNLIYPINGVFWISPTGIHET